jgi:ribose/xylose/arabinose/galactoside ABC-type transport system permease subunit
MTAVTEAETTAGSKRWLGALRRHQSTVGPWAILLLLVIVSALISPAFLSTTNLLNILRQAAPLMIVALGETLVILVGGIDVSVGAVIATTTVIGGSLMRDSDALIFPTVLVVIGVGVVVGLVHYLFIVRFRTDALVTTLGTMLILTGLNLIYTGGAPRSNVTDLFRKLSDGRLLGIPIIVIIALLMAAALAYGLRRSTFGRRVYAVGSNRSAARLAGVRSNRVEGLAYLACSVLAVVAGLGLLARIGTGDTAAGEGMELDAIAAVLIGGTAFGGGKGSAEGTVAGVLILTVLFNVFNLMGISRFAHLIVKGVVVIVGVALYSTRPRQGRG